MNYTLGRVLDELEGILVKKAEEQLSAPGNPGSSTGNVVYGNPDATEGAGKKLPGGVEGARDPGDLTDPEDPQHDSQAKRDASYAAKPQRAKDGQTVEGINSESESPNHQTKASATANRILAGLKSLLATQPGAEKQSGEKLAEDALRRLIQQEMRKQAEEDKKDEECPKDEEDKEEEAKEMPGEEKMSSHEWQEYQLAKQAGARAAVEFLSRLSGGTPAVSQANMQKQAAYQDYMLSKQAGANLAEQTIQRLLAGQQRQTEKRAAAPAPSRKFVHPSKEMSPDDAYEQMMKFASRAGVNPEALDGMLKQVYREQQLNGGPPRPFGDRGYIKASADVSPLMPILSGLLQDGTISQEEKAAILDYVASAESMNSDVLQAAVRDVAQKQAVLERLMAGDLPEHQRNANRAPSPEPAMPMTQSSPSALAAEEMGDVSQPTIPGSLEEHMKASARENRVIEAVLRSALKKVNPKAYNNL